MELTIMFLLHKEPAVVVAKKWGTEETIINNPLYCGKKMVLPVPSLGGPVMASSIHYHIQKTETLHVEKGALFLQMWDFEGDIKTIGYFPESMPLIATSYAGLMILYPGVSITIPVMHPHRFWTAANLDDSVNETVFFEFSTVDNPADSYRIVESGPLNSLKEYNKKFNDLRVIKSDRDFKFPFGAK